MNTSVSELARELLRSFVLNREEPHDRRRRLLSQVIEDITANGGGLRMADNLTREELYDRAAARAETEETERERRRRLMSEVFEDICATRSGFKASDNISREEIYNRHAIR